MATFVVALLLCCVVVVVSFVSFIVVCCRLCCCVGVGVVSKGVKVVRCLVRADGVVVGVRRSIQNNK